MKEGKIYVKLNLEQPEEELTEGSTRKTYKLVGTAYNLGEENSKGFTINKDGVDSSSLGTNLPLLYAHDTYSIPVGVATLDIKGERLTADIDMPLSDTRVKGQLVPQIEIGSLDGLSIGFRADEWVLNEDEDRFVEARGVKVHELSLTPFPAEEKARFNAPKASKSLSKEEPKKVVAETKEGSLHDISVEDIKNIFDKINK